MAYTVNFMEARSHDAHALVTFYVQEELKVLRCVRSAVRRELNGYGLERIDRFNDSVVLAEKITFLKLI